VDDILHLGTKLVYLIVSHSFAALVKVNAITSAIMLATATHMVLALATLGDAIQIRLFLFISLRQGKYNMCRCCWRHRGRYRLTFANVNDPIKIACLQYNFSHI